MRDGIYSFFITFSGVTIKGIALVESDAITGLDRSHVYSVEQLKYSAKRLLKHRNTHWRVKAIEHGYPDATRGFPAKLQGDEEEDQFSFEGESEADTSVKVEIQGTWLHGLPWHRAEQLA